MPSRLIDSQVSMNASETGSISTALTSTPTLFATLGLNMTTAGPNLEVQYTVTSMVNLIVTSRVTITVQRVVADVPTTIYSATTDLEIASRILVTFNGADFHPPADFVIYQAFISATAPAGLVPTRIGPESMIAAAYSD